MEISEVSRIMQQDEHSEIALCWFKNDFLKQNTDKCSLLASEYEHARAKCRHSQYDYMWKLSS